MASNNNLRDIDFLFSENPNPMWIYNPSDLSIRHANQAASELYGYSRQELQSMTIADLRPESEIPKLKEEVARNVPTYHNAGIWKHQKKNGNPLYVRVLSHPISVDEESLELVSVHDVTGEVQYRQELRMLLENSKDGIMLTSPDGRIHRANRAACDMLGMTEEEIINKGRAGLVHPDKKLRKALEERKKTGAFSGELTFIHSSGRKIPVELSTSVYTNLQGEKRTSMVIRDLSRHKQAHEKMRDALQERERILERITEAFFAVDENWTVTYWNTRAEEIIGKSREVVLDQNLWEMFPEAKELEFFKQYERAFETQEPTSFEAYYPPLEVWLELNAYPSPDGLSVFFRDITDRKQDQMALEKAYREKETILESIGDGFFTVNRDWIVTYWNSAAERLLKTPKETILGEVLWEVFSDATELPSYTKYHRVMEEGVPVDFEDYYAPLDRWYDISAYPAEEGISVYFKDITEQKRRDAQLRDSLKEKETLLAEVHHRVKNNLAVVSGMMQLQAFEESDERVREKLHDSVGRIKTMALIHEMLYQAENFSRLDSDANIKKLVKEIASYYQPAIDLDLTFDLQELPLTINQAMPVCLIINEVVTNIFKHAFGEGDQGTLRLKTRTDNEGHFVLDIIDDGKGLPDDFPASVESSSLGLQLIDTLAEQLDAKYDYASGNGETHFTLSFENTDVNGPSATGVL